MRTVFWFIAYSAALLVEIAVFSNSALLAGLPLSYAVFLTAIILLPFREGFWFAGVTGLARDLIAPAASASHVLFAFLLFLLVRAFLALAAWDEPLRSIAAFAIAAALTPLAAWGARIATGALGLGAGAPASALGPVAAAPLLFLAVWFAFFAAFSARSARRARERALGYL